MAISIDTVHQRVLALANKEQRGYITPQEFNLFANQAQREIFEQYFYELNQFARLPQNSYEYSNVPDILKEKIAVFEKFHIDMSAVSGSTCTLPTDVYRLGTVFYNDGTNSLIVEKVEKKELQRMNQAALYKPRQARPLYVRKNATQIVIYPESASPSFSTSTVNCHYIAKPSTAKWGSVIVNEKALYNSTTSVNFELHESEETSLVIKILELAGVTIKQQDITTFATNKDAVTETKEKQ